jgi:hypothetical protein
VRGGDGGSSSSRPSGAQHYTDFGVEELRTAGQAGKAVEFTSRAFAARSYEAVQRLCFEYVEVE